MNLTPLLEPDWFKAILPETMLVVGGLLLILLEAFFREKLRQLFAPIAAIILAMTSWVVVNMYPWVSDAPRVFFGGTYQVSVATIIFDLTFLLATLLAIMFSRDYLEREGMSSGEYYALMLWGTFGMMLMAKGLELLIVVLGLETLSICIFVLVGYNRRVPISNEASLKYFLMGAFATGFVLYGIALFYGATGSTNIPQLLVYFSTNQSAGPLLTIAFVLMMGGLGFKLALAPFHGWAPDVYQGAPTPVAGWLSTAPKAATLVVLLRIFAATSPAAEQTKWMAVAAVLSVLSMVLGNFVAIAQRDLKRMLAYSGIAHVGYMMLAVRTVREDAVAAIALYAVTYALMNIGAFGVISLLRKNQNDPHTLDDIAGMGFRHPFAGLALTVFMLSLAGIPPTAGFISKFYVFKVAIDAGDIGLAVVGICTSIVSVFYYLRVVYYLYMKEADELTPEPVRGAFATGALAIAIVGVFLVGIFPTPVFELFPLAANAIFLGH
ncbi:MAG: NADH-quinone oxidoreductase subunit N [Thermoanaerobaculia bacterium]|nr:NADH-quinone oxidoreductase subunit N [Thermoanaerobaculia bacterium]